MYCRTLMAKSLQHKARFLYVLAISALISSSLAAAEGLFPLTQYKLRNGLQVILSVDPSLPLVSVVVGYNVGSVDEPPGKTGLAFLMKNLMFSSGSENVPPNQHINYIHRVGGRFNASASEDKTVFYETVPATHLGLALWLESDRMKSLIPTETAFTQARMDLLDDLQRRRKDEPFLESLWSFDQLVYSDFAHSHPLAGLEDDVRTLTLVDAKAFYTAYYVPNNAVICVSGSFDPLTAKEWISRYFETIPRGKDSGTTSEPFAPARKQVMRTFEDATATAPGFCLGFPLGSPLSDDFPVLSLIDYILFRGRTSILLRRLTSQRSSLMTPVTGALEIRRDRAIYKIFVTANTVQNAEQYKALIFSELAKLKTTFLNESEVGRFKALYKMDYLRVVASSEERALYLAGSYLNRIPVETLPAELDRFLRITAIDVVGVLNRYFTAENSVLLNIKPK
jgi:zinc protease